MADIKLQSGNFKRVAEILLEAMEDKQEIALEGLVNYMKQNNYEKLLEYRPFYDFWIILHQKSPVVVEAQEKSDKLLFGGAFSLLINKGRILVVEETQGILEVTERFTIRNMILRLEEKNDTL